MSSASDYAQKLLHETFGFAGFRPGQKPVVTALLDGKNVLVVMPTGAGKSLCFQIPALLKGGLTIVVSPLVALMEDQVAALQLAGVAAETINSSRPYAVNADTWRRAAAGETRLLYISPERLMTERMLAALQKLDVTLLVVDEAHCISRWGPSFRPEYADLGRLSDVFPGVPIAAFTATADAATRKDIAGQLFNGSGETFVAGFDRPNIRLAVEIRQNWKRQLLDFLEVRKGESGIVYCLSRKKTDETATFLNGQGHVALPYHAGMDASDRARHQDIFMTEPGVIMVATIAFGMGIDKPDVRFVFHANLPGNMEAYYQEIGRAGRDGEPAEAFMLYGLDDIRMRRVFIEDDGSDSDSKIRDHKRLDALIAYCESSGCRRRALLSYFVEDTESCGNCDICQEPPELIDGAAPAAMILEAIRQTGQRFGTAHVVDVLRGGETEKIKNLGHDQLSVFGVGRDVSKSEWQSIIRQLVAAGFVRLDIQGYGGLFLTDAGASLANGHGTFYYRKDRHQASRLAKKAKAGSTAAGDLSQTESDLLVELKKLRLKFAQARGVPAYVIFPDRTLIDMAQRRPQTPDDFLEVNGVGEAKLRDFASPFLEVISAAEV